MCIEVISTNIEVATDDIPIFKVVRVDRTETGRSRYKSEYRPDQRVILDKWRWVAFERAIEKDFPSPSHVTNLSGGDKEYRIGRSVESPFDSTLGIMVYMSKSDYAKEYHYLIGASPSALLVGVIPKGTRYLNCVDRILLTEAVHITGRVNRHGEVEA